MDRFAPNSSEIAFLAAFRSTSAAPLSSFLDKEDVMVEMRAIFWVTVAITVLSGAASVALAARRNGSVASHRVADRLAQIAVVGASAIMTLLGWE